MQQSEDGKGLWKVAKVMFFAKNVYIFTGVFQF